MRFWTGLLILLSSAVAIGDEAQMQQWEKMDRCSNAAFIVVKILEESADTSKQALAVLGAVEGLKTNTKLKEATPTGNEIRGAYNFALRISDGMPRPFAKREHDWLVAQAATACTLWVPSVSAP
ncbi:hypothetical protein BK653_03660 [Pseudomonas brassicacearum]|uniref:hypothetical protein n=1 Tax=Pseudomonas brassicacearum TaxID=930166 RepID=UPI000FF04228|nr:hypothetical protein [Pseudomonas brassicacearum]ROM70990.1 hypothetical protein BK653_03660 [Pseudomonas brassicacearum]